MTGICYFLTSIICTSSSANKMKTFISTLIHLECTQCFFESHRMQVDSMQLTHADAITPPQIQQTEEMGTTIIQLGADLALPVGNSNMAAHRKKDKNVHSCYFYSGSSLHKFGYFMIRCWQEAGATKACDASSLFQRTFFLGHEADNYIWAIGKVENWRPYFMANHFYKLLIASLWP